MHPIVTVGSGTLLIATVTLALWEIISVRHMVKFRFGLALLGVLGALLSVSWFWLHGGPIHIAFFTIDRFGSFFAIIIFAITLLTLLQIQTTALRSEGIDARGYEGFSLLLLSSLGAAIAVYATNLIGIFLGIAMTTFTLAIWVGLSEDHWRWSEVSLRYFLTGGLAVLLFVYGVALLYGVAGKTSLTEIYGVLASRPLTRVAGLGLALLTAGLAIMMTWFPFHFHAADVAEKGRTTAIGYFLVVVKLTGLAVFIRIISAWWEGAGIPWHRLLVVAALLTLIVGNLKALPESNLKRRLAFGSIAQIGYILLGLAAVDPARSPTESALVSVVFYSLAYAVMTIGAFAVMVAIARQNDDPLELSDVMGLSRQQPWLAAALAVFLLALSGVPLTVGFIAKFYLIKTVLQSGHLILATIAVISWVISAYYYFDVIVAMYFKLPRPRKYGPLGYSLLTAVFGCVLVTLYWGVFPSNIFLIAGESVRSLLF